MSSVDPRQLPATLMELVTTLTGTTTSGSNQVSGLSTTSGISTDYYIIPSSGPGVFPLGTTIASINTIDKYIILNNPATSSGTISINVYTTSYATEQIYSAVPQYIQNTDATNGFPLYSFIYGIGQIVDGNPSIVSNLGLNQIIRQGIGPSGFYDDSYSTAPNWSQIIDINRCPTFALPWLAQFVGVSLANVTTRAQMVSRIQTHSNFQRGTVSAIINALLANINATAIVPIVAADIIVMEQTKYSSGSYLFDTYSMVILVPVAVFSQYTYETLNVAAAAYSSVSGTPTYAQLEAFIQSINGTDQYSNVSASTTPILNSGFAPYITNYRPAGLQVYIGGY